MTDLTHRPVADLAAARDFMVDSQVRPNKVTDPRVIAAMRRLPRERFVPEALAARAYLDEDVPLPGGRALMEPMVIARLAQILALRAGERVLVVAAGAGYGAAVLAACGAVVTALEDDAGLLAVARRLLAELAPEVTVVDGDVRAGWPAAAPYDAILIEGAVPALPDGLAEQLAPGGRLVTVLSSAHGLGQGVLAEAVPVGDGLRLRGQAMFDCATPMLPQFRPAPAFVF